MGFLLHVTNEYFLFQSRNECFKILLIFSTHYLLFCCYRNLIFKKDENKFTRVRKIVLPLQTIHPLRFSHWWEIVKWNFFFFLWWIIHAWEWFHHWALFKSLNGTEENGVKSSSEKVNLWKYCYLFYSIINTYWHLHVQRGKANH